MGVEWVSCRHRGLSRAMALHVAKFVGRSLRFSVFFVSAAEIYLWEPNRL
jgi:hypothetical protein